MYDEHDDKDMYDDDHNDKDMYDNHDDDDMYDYMDDTCTRHYSSGDLLGDGYPDRQSSYTTPNPSTASKL